MLEHNFLTFQNIFKILLQWPFFFFQCNLSICISSATELRNTLFRIIEQLRLVPLVQPPAYEVYGLLLFPYEMK